MPAVEQTKAKRAGIGLRGLGQERTNPGFTLFVPERWRQCLPHRHRGQCRSFLTDALPILSNEPVLWKVHHPKNGNTLICARDVLWSVRGNGRWRIGLGVRESVFWRGANGQNNRVCRPYRYSKEEIAKAKATGGG